MRILCTNPGKFGDILWSLPTVRAISQSIGAPVDFATSNDYKDIIPLVDAQPYIRAARYYPEWALTETGPCAPRVPPHVSNEYDRVVHLGYAGWPIGPTLPESHYKMAQAHLGELPPLDLDTPWIGEDADANGIDVHIGWNIMYPELKMGLTYAIAARFPKLYFNLVLPEALETRYEEWDWVPSNVDRWYCDWLDRASLLARAKVFLGCLSGQWVLANAMGKPTVIMEPAAGRNDNPLFWLDKPRNHLVRGNDGRATDNSRHVGDMLEEVLGGR